MTTIDRLTVRWDGAVGLPGFTNFHFNNAIGASVMIHDFFFPFKNSIPSPIVLTIPSSGETFNVETGELVGTWSEAGGTTIAGGNFGKYSAPVGAVVTWSTAGINRGRKVKGRTFIVPLASSAMDITGTLDAEVQGQIAVAAETFRTSGPASLMIWSRPVNKTGGAAFATTDSNVPDMAAVLRSRRD